MDVIIHAAATSFIHMQMLAVSQTVHNMRNTGRLIGPQGDSDSAVERRGVEGASSSGIQCCSCGCRARSGPVVWMRYSAGAPSGCFSSVQTFW